MNQQETKNVNVWNSLPSHIVSSPTLSTFKSRLENMISRLICYSLLFSMWFLY